MTNLSIVAADPARTTEIIVEPRYADVMPLVECDNVMFSGITMGHTETGSCEGDVVSMESCSNIILNKMDI